MVYLCTRKYRVASLRADENKLWLVLSAKQRRDLWSGPQRTQRITGSAFRISLQSDWLLLQRPFLTGQSWRVLKSGYTEQGSLRSFADGTNQSLVSSARRLGIARVVILSLLVVILYPDNGVTLTSKLRFFFDRFDLSVQRLHLTRLVA